MRTIGSSDAGRVPGWKLLAASLLLLVPVVPVAMAVQGSPEPQKPRAAIVLPAAVEAPRVVLQPAPAPAAQPDCGAEDDDDDDEGVLVVHPCPGAVGDDEDDDDRGGDDEGDD